MKIVNWKFENLEIKMIDLNGELFTSTNILCKALGISTNSVRGIVRRYREVMESLGVNNSPVTKSSLTPFKRELEMKRVGENTRLWSESQMIFISTKVSSEKATRFILDLLPFIKQHAIISHVSEADYLSQEQHRRELGSLREEMVEMMQSMKTFSHGAKSTLGRMNNLGNRASNVIEGNFSRRA